MAEIVGVDVKPETDMSENAPESPPLGSNLCDFIQFCTAICNAIMLCLSYNK